MDRIPAETIQLYDSRTSVHESGRLAQLNRRTLAPLLLLLTAGLASAGPAFTGLATNSKGSKLWFSSRLRLKGTDTFPHGKIFTWDATLAAAEANDPGAGFRLLEQREAQLSFPSGGVLSSTHHDLILASVSGDGTVVALTALDDCINFTMCAISDTRYQATISQSRAPARTEPGRAVLSASGQFVLLRQAALFPKARILNLATGGITPPFDQPSGGAQNTTRQISNDGTALLSGVLRLPCGDVRVLPPALNCLALNAAATRAYCADNRRVSVLDIASGRVTTIFTAQNAAVYSFDISESGDQVVVLDESGLWFVRADGTGLRRLAAPGIGECTISGDGNVVFGVAEESRLLRIETGTGTTTELVPRTPAIRLERAPGETLRTDLVKGSAYEYRVPIIPPIAQVRLPGGTVAPAFHAGPELVSFHVPFEAPTAGGWPELVLASQPAAGPFVASVLPLPVNVVAFSPFWYTQGGQAGSSFFPVAALHQDFRGPITANDPALASEIIHVYGGGFGPVEPAPLAGQPAGANPLSRVTQQPLECTLRTEDSRSAEILYAGLAPGWIGLYQLDLRLPEVATPVSGNGILRCGIPNSTSAIGLLPYRPR